MFKCTFCDRDFKSSGGRNLHEFKKHSQTTAPVVAENKAANLRTDERGMVTFISPRSPSLRIVINPTRWTLVNTPAGGQMQQVEGLSVQFDEGLFRTSDPTIIDYLENKYSKSDRFPVFSQKMLSEMGR